MSAPLRKGMLSDLFEAVVTKKLTLVETITPKSNQHEFQGTRPFRKLFGDVDRKGIPARFIWIQDEQEALAEDGFISWSNVRKGKPRAAEYHLYYSSNAVTGAMQPGDGMFLAMRREGTAMVIVTPAQSTIQNQLVWLFGLESQPELEFIYHEVNERDSARLDFAARYILDELGIELEEPEVDALDSLIEKFGARFPATRQFSQIARDSLPEVSPFDDPDAVLFSWMEREELLFRRIERHIVANRIRAGFTAGPDADVEGFLSFSLSVQQRRRSRVGFALENHLEALFATRNVRYARGAETERGNKPDFLFPGSREYHKSSFSVDRLTMLGVKSTLKDRWRQVLTEAARISRKHLLTFEPGISTSQTDQIRLSNLQLVIPKPIHATYQPAQRSGLLTVRDFLDLVLARQNVD